MRVILKKICCFVILCSCILVVSSCSAPSIEGYWLSEFNESLSFDGNGTVVVNGTAASYSIFDTDKIQIICDDFLSSFTFNGSFRIEDNILYLKNLDTSVTSVYYGDPETQEAIRQAIAEAELEAQRALEDQEAAAIIASQIAYLKDQISRYEVEIQLLKNQIESCYSHISNNKEKLSLCYDNISEYEKELNHDLPEENREYIQDLISYEYDDIDYLNECIIEEENQITLLQSLIAEYENEIVSLNAELSEYE